MNIVSGETPERGISALDNRTLLNPDVFSDPDAYSGAKPLGDAGVNFFFISSLYICDSNDFREDSAVRTNL